MRVIDGGVTAPEGFFASGMACGLKKDKKKDLAIVCSEDIAASAGVFTTNIVKGHSLQVTMEHLKSGYATAVIINSGNANACVGEQGYKDAKEIAEIASEYLECTPDNILLGSTGVIGVPLNMDVIRPAIEALVSNMSLDGGHDAAEAIMTTDLIPKEIAVEFEVQENSVIIGGMAKGSGMIHPQMATMIGVITTDANISRSLLNKALIEVVKNTFNRVSVDGDTSVCDMVIIMANGLADNPAIITENEDYEKFRKSLNYVCTELSKMIARDGEGATKLIISKVVNAADKICAQKVAKSIISSNLLKAAMFASDANWGRILCAIGNVDCFIDVTKIDVSLKSAKGEVIVCKNGYGEKFDNKYANQVLDCKEVEILVDLKSGDHEANGYGCDLTYEYVKINAEYRT